MEPVRRESNNIFDRLQLEARKRQWIVFPFLVKKETSFLQYAQNVKIDSMCFNKCV